MPLGSCSSTAAATDGGSLHSKCRRQYAANQQVAAVAAWYHSSSHGVDVVVRHATANKLRPPGNSITRLPLAQPHGSPECLQRLLCIQLRLHQPVALHSATQQVVPPVAEGPRMRGHASLGRRFSKQACLHFRQPPHNTADPICWVGETTFQQRSQGLAVGQARERHSGCEGRGTGAGGSSGSTLVAAPEGRLQRRTSTLHGAVASPRPILALPQLQAALAAEGLTLRLKLSRAALQDPLRVQTTLQWSQTAAEGMRREASSPPRICCWAAARLRWQPSFTACSCSEALQGHENASNAMSRYNWFVAVVVNPAWWLAGQSACSPSNPRGAPAAASPQ